MMNLDTNILIDFLKEINEFDDWVELKLEVEFQPGMLGFKGWAHLKDSTQKSLRSRPTEELKTYVKHLHSKVAINSESRWNKLEFILFSDTTFKRIYIWDSKWQKEIDFENKKYKEKNPEYQLPRWKWQKL